MYDTHHTHFIHKIKQNTALLNTASAPQGRDGEPIAAKAVWIEVRVVGSVVVTESIGEPVIILALLGNPVTGMRLDLVNKSVANGLSTIRSN